MAYRVGERVTAALQTTSAVTAQRGTVAGATVIGRSYDGFIAENVPPTQMTRA